MNIWDESPPEPTDEPAATSSEATPEPGPETGGAGGGSGGGSEPPSEPPEPGEEPERRWWSQRIAGIPAWLLLTLGVAIWLAVIAALVIPGSDDEPDIAEGVLPSVAATSQDDTTAPTLPTTSTTPPTTVPTISNAPTTPSTTVAPTTAPATDPTTSAPTTAPATTTTTTTPATTTTTAASTTTTTAPPATTTTTTTTTAPATTTTTAPAATTTTVPGTTPVTAGLEPTTVVGDDGQSITVTPYEGPCSSGPECLVVGFTIDGWATHPMNWVCEFSSGARYTFKFEKDGADPACSTVDVPDSIVVEINGLRTEPITIG